MSDERVISDYLAAKAAYVAAYNPPDPEHSDLVRWYDGDSLEGTQAELQDLVAKGHSEAIEYEHDPDVVTVEPDGLALVHDCYGVQVTTVDTATGEQIGDVAQYTRNVDFTLELRSDRWVIVNGNRLDSECTPGE